MAYYMLTSLFRVNEPYLVYNEALAKRMKLRKCALARELAVQSLKPIEICPTS
jgi:hypothetical protein